MSTIQELILIAETIDKFASGPIPWGGCRCDHGEDGRCLLRGDKCGRCKARDRLKEIKAAKPQESSWSPRELESRIHEVRLAAAHNRFSVELASWLAEICKLAKIGYERVESQDEYDHKDSEFGPFL